MNEKGGFESRLFLWVNKMHKIVARIPVTNTPARLP